MSHFFYAPPPPFVGGAQPHAGKVTAAPPGWSVDNPPGIMQVVPVALPLVPLPTLSQRLNPAALNNPINDPGYYQSRVVAHEVVVTGWQPPPPLPTRPRWLFPAALNNVVVVNNPVFNTSRVVTHNIVVASWQPVPPQAAYLFSTQFTAGGTPSTRKLPRRVGIKFGPFGMGF